MKLSVIKGALIPGDDEARATLNKKFRIGDSFEVEVLNERWVKFNSKIHVILDDVAKTLGITMQQLRAEILIETGRAENLKLRDGTRVWALPSMSRASMTQKELTTFWDDARLYIRNQVMPSLPGEQQARVSELIDDGVPA